MAVNITLAGKVYDNNDQIVTNAAYQGIVFKNGVMYKTSNIRVTEQTGDYNFNLGAADWLGQEGTISTGDAIYILVWTPDTANRLTPDIIQFCYYSFSYNSSSNLYINDIYLNSYPTFNCSNVLISPSTQLINQNITWNFTSTDRLYEKYGKTYRQSASVLGVQIFPSIALDLSQSYFDFGSGYIQGQNVSSISTSGTHTLKVKAYNKAGTFIECSREYEVTSAAPQGCLSYFPNVIYTQDTINISGCSEVNESVYKIGYYFDNELVAENLEFNYTYSKIISVYKSSYEAKQILYYNNGIDNFTSTKIINIPIANKAPVITLTSEEDDEINNKYLFTNTSTDFENETITYKWEISYLTPFNNEYSKVYGTSYITDNTLETEFLHPGSYRITSYSKDASGYESFKFVDISIVCKQEECPECPEVEIRYVYVTNHEISVDTEDNDLVIDINTIEVIVDSEPVNIILDDLNSVTVLTEETIIQG